MPLEIRASHDRRIHRYGRPDADLAAHAPLLPVLLRRSPAPRRAPILTALLAALAAAASLACTAERAELSILARDGGRVLATSAGDAAPRDAGRVVYTYADENTVDVYFTDVPPRALRAWLMGEPAPRWTDGGVVAHLHMFLWPVAGRTPIDFDASNATITLAVVAPHPSGRAESVAIYSGGGFMLPTGLADAPGGAWFRARTRGATIELRALSPNAEAPIREGAATGSVRARLEPETAREIALGLLGLLDAAESRLPEEADER